MQADVLAELHIRDAFLGDEAADESFAGSEVVPGLATVSSSSMVLPSARLSSLLRVMSSPLSLEHEVSLRAVLRYGGVAPNGFVPAGDLDQEATGNTHCLCG